MNDIELLSKRIDDLESYTNRQIASLIKLIELHDEEIRLLEKEIKLSMEIRDKLSNGKLFTKEDLFSYTYKYMNMLPYNTYEDVFKEWIKNQ